MNLNKEKNYYSLLSCQTRSILLGSLLGDGSLKIHKGYKNARFSFRHTIKQQDYFLWKRDQIKKDLSGPRDMWEQKPSSPWSLPVCLDHGVRTQNIAELSAGWQDHKLRYQSRALPSLSYLYYLTHKGGYNGNIRLWRKWLNMMDAQALAIWWCDDGSLVSNTKQGVFCTDGFSLKDVQVLDRYMKKIWGLNTAIFPVGKVKIDGTQRYRLWFRSVTDLKKFLRIVIPHIPVYSMLYKVIILYKDSQLQQRWISEIVENSQYTLSEVEAVVQKRKSELKAFSENDIVHSV